MKDFTVVLLRPEYLNQDAHDHPGQNIYVANVQADDEYHAVKVAQVEVYEADLAEQSEDFVPRSLDDYILCVLFEGTIQPKLFGWQIS